MRAPSRRWAWGGLGVVLAVGLALRLWGVGQGLPYAYNADEADHFVPRAVDMFSHNLDPHYFANPPAFTYLLHFLFAAWYGGATGVRQAVSLHPGEVYTLGRIAAAVLGTAALWLLYATGARLFGRGVGLLAAAIEAVAFLPVFYSHLALNDVPTLAPMTLSLLGSAGVLRRGRRRDYLVAGVGLGLACATKYPAGIALLPLAAASAARYLDRSAPPLPGSRRPSIGPPGLPAHPLAGIAIAAAAAIAAFLIANPYAVLDFESFHRELVRQSALSAEAQGKLGAPREGGVVYYLWSLSWGLGWVPAVAALGGAVTVWRFQPRVGWVLVPAAVLFIAFMGLQGRYFGRWLLPIFPILCLLAAFLALELAGALARRLQPARRGGAPRRAAPRRRALIVAATVVLLCGQGALYSIHSGLVLSRADTRNLTRAWMLARVPAGAPIVLEPVAPAAWAREAPRASSASTGARGGDRWVRYTSLVSRISAAGALLAGAPRPVGIEDYERTLSPALIGYYERQGYCWVVSGSTESGRALADPGAVPEAIAYYRALARRGEVVYHASPYARGRGPVAFNFDWSFDYYPLAYDRPGPGMTVYRLHGGRCR
jgi:hypothetical protein